MSNQRFVIDLKTKESLKAKIEQYAHDGGIAKLKASLRTVDASALLDLQQAMNEVLEQRKPELEVRQKKERQIQAFALKIRDELDMSLHEFAQLAKGIK